MSRIKLDPQSFQFLDSSQFAELGQILRQRRTKKAWRRHEICNALHIGAVDATLVMATLDASQLAELFILVYHQHCEEIPVDRIPARQGLPPLPFECEECQRTITEYSELRFDTEMLLTG